MPDRRKRATVWSYGGGTQSVAIACLIASGELPRPELAIIADTGREVSETWEYLDANVRPLLARVGVPVEVVPHSYATVDLYGKNGDLLLPAYTLGGEGKLPTYCSVEWKRRAVRRRLREMGYGPDRPINLWIGYSVNEVGRVSPSDAKWCRHEYPLIMRYPVDREQCKGIILRAGLPLAPRSRCRMCPHQLNAEWRSLPPAELALAIQEDVSIREHDANAFLHRSGVPLAEADLTTPDDPPDPLFGGLAECNATGCYT